MSNPEALRALPQVDQILREVDALADVGPVVARWLARREIDAARARIQAGDDAGDVNAALDAAARALTGRRVRRVINATGVVLHTNLGRAPLSDAAKAAVADATNAVTLEFDPAEGERGARAPVAPTLAAALCDAEDALVVNNNAGALLLMLGALARGREVIVGRGEMIEIGGAFRLPDVMEASGAVLREVGTTNRTRLSDYEAALTDRTALILKVHPSNYRVVGFTETPSIADLAGIADVPLAFDIGSGLLTPEDGPLADEPDASTALASGADLVCFSGDKLLGGPQAGILAGRRALVERCRRDPVARAVRADKLSLAALEATLWAHARGERATIPTWAMLHAEPAEIKARAEAIAGAIGDADVVDGESVTGGGSLPGTALPTALLRVRHDKPHALARALRAHEPPIVARIDRDAVVVDLRTVDPADDQFVTTALRAAR